MRALRASPPRPVRRGARRAPLRLPPPARERLTDDAPVARRRAREAAPAARHLPAVRRRDVGALLVLRDARASWCCSPRTRTRGGLGWSQASASRLMSFYGFLAYSLPVLGGWLADRFLGTHRALVIGGLHHRGRPLHARDAVAVPTFFLGLALVAIGTGFFKANASTMVGQLYQQGRSAARRRLHDLLHGRQRGRALRAARLRLPGGEPALGLALGLRRRRRRDGARASSTYLALRQRIWPASAGAHPDRVDGARRDGRHAPLTREERDRLIALLVIFFVHDLLLDGVRAGRRRR